MISCINNNLERNKLPFFFFYGTAARCEPCPPDLGFMTGIHFDLAGVLTQRKTPILEVEVILYWGVRPLGSCIHLG